MPRSQTKQRPCRLCLGPVDAGRRGWCAGCHLALAAHGDMMLLLQPHTEAGPRRARDPARLARIARYEDRAARGLPLFAREEVPPWARR